MKNALDREIFKMRIKIQFEDLKDNSTVKEGKHYAISDIHGMYGSYMEAIGKISEEDCLYILGDVIDRGNDGIKILLDIIERQKNPGNGPKIIFLIGNHEVMFLQTVKIMLDHGLNRDDLIRFMEGDYIERFKSKGVDKKKADAIMNWIICEHGYNTIFSYLEDIEPSKRKQIYNFLLESYVILPQEIGEKDFLFVHAMPIDDRKKLEEMKKSGEGYNIMDLTLNEYRFMLTERENQTYQLAQDVGFTTICGHTPSQGNIRNNKDKGFVRIDAGCGHKKQNSKLALYCIEDDKVEYIDEKRDISLDDPR